LFNLALPTGVTAALHCADASCQRRFYPTILSFEALNIIQLRRYREAEQVAGKQSFKIVQEFYDAGAMIWWSRPGGVEANRNSQ
jgi:hypothetical protein